MFDVTIIGGGIVGLATSLHLINRYPDYKFLVLEKENAVGMHQTGHNSGVIHSGIYYQPGSLKAKLSVEGVQAMIAFAQDNNISYEICGKLILATEEKQVPWLKALYERGAANNVPGLELIGRQRIKEIEPNATGVCGIYSPKTGIINYKEVAFVMKQKFVKAGGRVDLSQEVRKIQNKPDGWILNTSKGDIRTRYFINCGGLHSDRIARLSGLQPDVSIIPFRGEYYLIRKERINLVKNLIYPVPQPELPFLGVHFTRTIDGKYEAGPNAILALGREAYQRTQFKAEDVLDLATSIAFWKMISKYWKTGIFECYRALSKSSFVEELRKMVPSVTEDDLEAGPTGIRAQAVDHDGNLVNDFKIMESKNAIHVLNVPSPAATASLTIGDYIVKLAASAFSLRN